jgi:hypothetical protein
MCRASRGEERVRERCGPLEQAVTLGACDPGQGGLQELTHAAVGEVVLELAGAGPQASEASLAGDPGGRPEQAGLAEARSSLHDHDPAVPLLGRPHRVRQLAELALTLQ